MTATQLLASLRTLLDEDTEQYWLDPECYTALTNGQKEYASIVLAQYKAKAGVNPFEPLPEVLRPLLNPVTQSLVNATYLPLPPNYLYDLSVYVYGTYNRPFFKRKQSRSLLFEQVNSLLGAQGYYYSIDNVNLNFEIPAPSVAINIDFKYLMLTPPIDGSLSPASDPVLPDFTHDAIVQYAYSELLKKPKRTQESLAEYQKFLQTIKYI